MIWRLLRRGLTRGPEAGSWGPGPPVNPVARLTSQQSKPSGFAAIAPAQGHPYTCDTRSV